MMSSFTYDDLVKMGYTRIGKHTISMLFVSKWMFDRNMPEETIRQALKEIYERALACDRSYLRKVM